MEYSGHVSNGVVVLDSDQPLPEGMRVRVLPVEADEHIETAGQLMLRYAGRARDLPNDMAAQHDHYLHGQPKR